MKRLTGIAPRIMKADAPAMKRKKMNSPISVLPARNAPEMMFRMYDCELDEQGTIDRAGNTYNGYTPFPTLPVCDHGQEQRSDGTAGKEEAIGCSDESIRI